MPAQIYVRRIIRHKLVLKSNLQIQVPNQFESNPHIQVIGCWAHARRKWLDALDEDKRTASEALAYINKLCHIENEARHQRRRLEGKAIEGIISCNPPVREVDVRDVIEVRVLAKV